MKIDEYTPDIIYTAVLLYYDDVLKILDVFHNIPIRESHWIPCSKHYCDHMTLHFGKMLKKEHLEDLGRVVQFKIIRIVTDGHICAAEVDRDSIPVSFDNKYPHVTLTGDGFTAPKISNDLLLRYHLGDKNIHAWKCDITVAGIIKAYCANQMWIE